MASLGGCLFGGLFRLTNTYLLVTFFITYLLTYFIYLFLVKCLWSTTRYNMRPTEYADELVIEAGNALQAADRRVTGYALRQQIGGGEPNRLRAVWQAYLDREATTEAPPPPETLPAEFAETLEGVTTALVGDIHALASRLWQRATEIAESRTREAIQTAKAAQAQAEAELEDANTATLEQDKRIGELEAALEQAHTEGQAARQEAETRAQQLKTLEATHTEARTEIKTLRAQLQEAEKALAQAQAAQQTAERAQQQATDTLMQREQTYQDSEIARQKLEGTVIRLETQVQALHESREQAERHADQLAMALANLRNGPTDTPSPASPARSPRRGKPPGGSKGG
jgi:hypothetical protein